MRTSLIIFGMIFLVFGILAYLVPMQEVSADTTTSASGDTDVRTSSAKVTIPTEWAVASSILGFILLLLGVMIPSPIVQNTEKNSYVRNTKIIEKDSDLY